MAWLALDPPASEQKGKLPVLEQQSLPHVAKLLQLNKV